MLIPVWLPRGVLWLWIGSQTFGISSPSLKLAEMTCWMKSISKITQYLPSKSITTSVSYRAFSICQVLQGIRLNPKKGSGTLTTPCAAVFRMVFFEKTFLNSETFDHQLFPALSALSSEQGLMHPIWTPPCPTHRDSPKTPPPGWARPTRGSAGRCPASTSWLHGDALEELWGQPSLQSSLLGWSCETPATL